MNTVRVARITGPREEVLPASRPDMSDVTFDAMALLVGRAVMSLACVRVEHFPDGVACRVVSIQFEDVPEHTPGGIRETTQVGEL